MSHQEHSSYYRQAMREYLPTTLKNLRVLDIGCGTGHDLDYFVKQEAETYGIDIAKKMVDHALARGWDHKNGGFYYEGYYFNNVDTITIINDKKIWWVQAEGLNALLLMSKLFPREERYFRLFEEEWAYIKSYLVDHKYGGWYEEGLDNSPVAIRSAKAFEWKVNYHNIRALMNCIRMLKDEHELIHRAQE